MFWKLPPFLREDLPRTGRFSLQDRRVRSLVYAFLVIFLWGAITLFVYQQFWLYLNQPQRGYLYFVSRYLYLVPILVAGLLLGRIASTFVGLLCSALFVPRLTQLLVETGFAAATIETTGMLLLYNLAPLLISSLVEFNRRQTILLDTVNQLGQVIEMTLDAQALLPLVSRQSLVLGGADGAQICLKATFSDSSASGRNVSLVEDLDWFKNITPLDSRSLPAWILAQEEPVVLPNLADDPRFVVPPEMAAKRPAVVGIPLRRVGKTFAVLLLWRYWGYRFSGDAIKTLYILADKAQMAIENAWLYSQTDQTLARRAKELAILLKATNTFTSIAHQDDLLNMLCKYVVDFIGASFCRVFLLDQDSHTLTIRAAYSVPGLVWDPGTGSTFPAEALPWHQWVISSGQPLVMRIEDYREILREPEFSVTFCAGAKSVLLLPLQVKGQSLGVAVVGERRLWERTPFDQQKVDLCLSMARQASLALENIVALEAIQAQRQQIQLIIDNVADGVFSTDLEGLITAFNPAAERITGFRAEDVIGLSCREAFVLEGQTMCALCAGACPVSAVLSNKTPSESVQQTEWITTPSGTRRLIAHVVAPLTYGGKEIRGTVSVIRDVSREEELVRLKSEFISLVSHQLRTPLAGIRASVELLNKEGIDEAMRRDLLETLNRQSIRLSRLVDQVLTASRLEKAQTRLLLEPLALLPIVQQTVDMYRSQFPDRRFEFENACYHPFILGDQAAFEVVLENLIQNAVKYSPPEGVIRVSMWEDKKHITVVVSDQGEGIPSDQLEYVFQPFHRLVRDGKGDQTYGFGLGLYIAKRLVEDQGGKIWVESRLGEGTSFYVQFPRLEVTNGEDGENIGC